MSDREEIEELISRVAQKDREAFEALYDRVSAKLFGVCLRVLTKHAAAEDAMQDTFVKVWNNADRYRSNGLSPMTWLITIARNTAIDRLRARKKGHQTINKPGLELIAPEPSPEQFAVATSEAAKLSDCLNGLEADRGAAIRGAYLDGLTYADLAKRFDVPLNTMRTWLRRGLIALRACMST
ncbi:RNA polymerase sigma-70 factor [Sulfitobacter noctilucicola]|uniref:RNA polymerase sigma-70 factor (ECF subfamily) n=1 Tax=Sulfitobacter noctilucicola TaxID=1342301 RepID=A0A7W6M935_9RHOB|nr:sigma-70 family RNA polymerase sigma factor [Sulfitobacter noctilucicola]KIN63773.1 RNA polymerase sigma-70 factor [Sulfitobacter noctilucicola]MBB4174718.1 RNA polymerase sigma-70 factor (ECF subfamily) [Sulfitobacter noctilucicola]